MSEIISVIMFGEVIGFILYSIFYLIFAYTKNKNNPMERRNLREELIIHIVFSIILILSLCFSFPSLTFFSVAKLIAVSILVTCFIVLDIATHFSTPGKVLFTITFPLSILVVGTEFICTIMYWLYVLAGLA